MVKLYIFQNGWSGNYGNKYEKWTLKEILMGKLIPFILLTLSLTKVLNEAVNYGMTYYVNLNNNMEHPLYTHKVLFALGKFGIILAIPAALISIWIINMFIKFKKSPPPSATVPRGK